MVSGRRTSPAPVLAPSWSLVVLGLSWALGCGCTTPGLTVEGGETEPRDGEVAPAPAPASSCAAEPIPETRAPDVRPEYDTADFWLARFDPEAIDGELLDPAVRDALAREVASLPGGWRDPLDPGVAAAELVDAELGERMTWLRERVDSGKYIEGEAGVLDEARGHIRAARSREDDPHAPAGTLHLVTRETTLWCIPSARGLFTEPVDPDFDRNKCSSLHMGELVRAIASTPEDEAGTRWTYVEAGYSVGWVRTVAGANEGAPLGPPMELAEARAWLEAPSAHVFADHDSLRAGARFPLDPEAEAEADPDAGLAVRLPAAEGEGFVRARLPAGLHAGEAPLPFSRRNVLTQAFSQLDQPYGWGGRGGHRDCSRYLKDLFAQFGVLLPRSSGAQAKLGRRSEDVSELGEQAKRAAIRAANEEGIVLLYMPGHIMLYLGEDGGHDYAISALSEYLEPCTGGDDSIHKLDRVGVTTLELGRGSERRAFIERISRIAVF